MRRRDCWARGTAVLLVLLLQNAAWAAGTERNGFVLEPASIPAEEILAGGPRRDGIPALDHPSVLRAADADWGRWGFLICSETSLSTT